MRPAARLLHWARLPYGSYGMQEGTRKNRSPDGPTRNEPRSSTVVEFLRTAAPSQGAWYVYRHFPASYAAAGVVLLSLLAPVNGAHAEDAHPISVWKYSLYKTITYETAANLADIPLYNTMMVGAVASTGVFTAVNVATAAMAYYVHELVWNLYGPSEKESESTAARVGFEKLLMYRVVSTTRNLLLGYAFTGNASATLGFALINNATDIVVYISNEYAWYAFGPPVAIAPDDSAAPPQPTASK